MTKETMSTRDAYIAHRALMGIQKVAERHWDSRAMGSNYQCACRMYEIIGKLEFEIFGYAVVEHICWMND